MNSDKTRTIGKKRCSVESVRRERSFRRTARAVSSLVPAIALLAALSFLAVTPPEPKR
jgi:hypothetical protein